MKIGPNSSHFSDISSLSDPKSGAGSNPVFQVPAEDASSSLTGRTTVESLKGKALAAPEIRASKVDGLRGVISNGQYELDSTAIADSILGEFGKALAQ
jgi:flagellar biosynthesis anti-sigma factor FlgM